MDRDLLFLSTDVLKGQLTSDDIDTDISWRVEVGCAPQACGRSGASLSWPCGRSGGASVAVWEVVVRASAGRVGGRVRACGRSAGVWEVGCAPQLAVWEVGCAPQLAGRVGGSGARLCWPCAGAGWLDPRPHSTRNVYRWRVAVRDFTIAVCPGIGNSSETVYIWSFVHYACLNGYRCIVLNHLGALRSVKVTSPRIFCYGRTEELDVMLKGHMARHPLTRLVLVGFSMGGNIVTKYMGQPAGRRTPSIIGAVSICQGYDAQRCVNALLWWREFRRFYLHMMTENMKAIIMRHRAVLFTDDVKARYQLDERKIFMAATMTEFDEAYTR
ncbi:abhydrolase domain-containing protein 2-like [Pollicipes pollicipes]|uniref:abhydrolase domain-containing protein 2-like n=1 Tax=Pollicipes pollicipes TaxID=41117 RepID=UPI0018852B34|nr:abhydrolase domain-containing protein 2-like [Pollicipes pollicipes]